MGEGELENRKHRYSFMRYSFIQSNQDIVYAAIIEQFGHSLS